MGVAQVSVSDCSILIIDDDPAAIQIVRRALHEHSDVRFATNGIDALRLARERPPDAILLDGEMPGEDGFEVCRKLKADFQLRDIPVIFVTSHDELAYEMRALDLGAADFISKPVSAPRVQMRVRLHLQLKKQMDLLRALATTDDLTKLANRRTFNEALAREWARSNRSGHPLSLLMIDVDSFKLFNDAYGHLAGDECLKAVGAVIGKAARRPTDLAGRFGGEEFVILLPETPSEGARLVADRVRDSVREAGLPHRASKVAPYVTVSIGVSCRESRDGALGSSLRTGDLPSASNERELIAAADRALYLAKDRGRNRVEVVRFNAQSP